MKHAVSCLLPALLALTAATALAAPKTYPDGHGGEVTFPEGDVSFADAVVRYATGSKAPKASAGNPEQALGIPDVDRGGKPGFVSLGCGGELVLQFTNNALVDVPGPDLYVFEIGHDVEPTALAISNDGKAWTRVGRIEGGKAEIDIAPYVGAGQSFRYVQLVDLKSHCGSSTPGADVDAVGAIGSARHIALSGEVLFDTGKYTLKLAATSAIDTALADIDTGNLQAIVVAGHTDSVGNDASNLTLSENRARAVAHYLIEQAGIPANKVKAEGHGENQPMASNDTAAGRAQNRRVEITVHTTQPQADIGTEPRIEILGLWHTGDRLVGLQREADKITGFYSLGDGHLVGTFISDTVFEGYWYTEDSPRQCATAKPESDRWGDIRITFESAARDAFDTQWRYCDEDTWRGSWPHAERLL